jgi:ABC-type lipoprotein export system ATPase subunit
LNSNGKTVIVITHDHEVAGFANRVITLKDGKVASDLAKEEAYG